MTESNYYLISFPRSGQHLTERLLQKICDYFKQSYSYCEFYECCTTVPCKKQSRFMKNHDFDLKYEILPNEKYIVLYRTDYIHQLESYFRIVYAGVIKKFNYLENPFLYRKLLEFIIKKTPYRTNFINKWVKNDSPNILKINYDDVIKNPKNYLENMLAFMKINYNETDILNILSSFEEIKYMNRLPHNLYTKIVRDLQEHNRREKLKLEIKPEIKQEIKPAVRKQRSWKLF